MSDIENLNKQIDSMLDKLEETQSEINRMISELQYMYQKLDGIEEEARMDKYGIRSYDLDYEYFM